MKKIRIALCCFAGRFYRERHKSTPLDGMVLWVFDVVFGNFGRLSREERLAFILASEKTNGKPNNWLRDVAGLPRLTEIN